MKFTLSWLKDHLETDAPLSAIAEKLTAIGLEVEGISDPAAALASFKVARIDAAEKHPDADRLRVCRVDTGKEILQIVCGAPNARAGIKVVLALPGAVIPASGMALKKGSIRGVESQGMMCSARELCLSDEHEGIIELPADAALGSPAATALGQDDPLIDVNLTPNRGDCAGVRGIARDLAAAGIGTLKPLAVKAVAGQFSCPIAVAIEDSQACPAFAGRLIRGVKNGPSPEWLQRKLQAVGLRPISALVDITNYMSLDWPRPLHVFDADKLAGRKLTVRGARDGEKLAALNGKTYELSSGMTVIADDSGVLSLGGVMGGASTGCTESTVTVYVESAYFAPESVAATGQKLQILSDARYRFERGIDPESVIPGMEWATQMILDLCGGTPSEIALAGGIPEDRRVISFDPARVKKLTGVEVPEDEQTSLLSAVGCRLRENGRRLDVIPPSWRSDITQSADLVEEILRLHGFDEVPATSVPRLSAMTSPALDPRQRRVTLARRLLAARGLNEAVTWSFIPHELAAAFGGGDEKLRIRNPISVELDQMRPSILGNLLLAAQRNSDRGFPNGGLFEIGPVFLSGEENGQETQAAILRTGRALDRHWHGQARAVDAFDVKADSLALLEGLGAPTGNLQVTRDAPGYYHPGRSGALRLGPTIIAVFGELHPDIKALAKFEGDAVAAEIYLAKLPMPKKSGTARPDLKLAPLQRVQRDFAFLVEESISADALLRAVKAADKKLIVDAAVFDVYKGGGLPDGAKSLACSVTLQPGETALTEKDLEMLSQAVVASVKAAVGGSLRG